MKKIISIIITVLMIGCCGMDAKTNGKSAKKKPAASGVVVSKGETQKYGDYLTTQFFTVSKGKNKKVILEFPIEGNEKLVAAIRKDLFNELNLEDKNNIQSIESLLKKADINELCSTSDSFEHKHSVAEENGNIISYEAYCGITLIGGNTFLIADGSSLCDVIDEDIDNLKPYLLREIPDHWMEDCWGSFFVKDQKLYLRAF